MLVLSRKIGDTIEIDGGIVLQVLKVQGSTVRLGLVAPQEVNIKRGELPTLANGIPARQNAPETPLGRFVSPPAARAA